MRLIPSDLISEVRLQRYALRLEGRETEGTTINCETLDEARNEAVRFLGAYLSGHPGFADEGHWRVNVEDETGRHLLHVIVATVTSRGMRQRQTLQVPNRERLSKD